MKKLLYFTLTFGLLTQSCLGPEGPVGPPGTDGADGLNAQEAYVFEYEFDLESPDYKVVMKFPNDFKALDSDVVLVYLLWEKQDNGTEVWRLLPQLMITDFGLLNYNFDFTKFDAAVFLEADFDRNKLGSQLLDNWLARVVVIPGQFEGRVDYSNYQAVKELYNLPDKEIPAGYVVKTRPE